MPPTLADWAEQRLTQLRTILQQLLSSTSFAFDEHIHSVLPEKHGIYAIRTKNARPGEILRAGRTKSAVGGLRQRVYRNHFMGNQPGNLRSQLVEQAVCNAMEETKNWIRANCTVQYFVIEDDEMRRWAEYIMLAVLQPKCCD